MKDILDALAQSMHDQMIALQTIADQLVALKQTLAKHDSEVASELNAQIEAGAQQEVSDRVTAVQQTLAKHDASLADELKSQVQADQEKSRVAVYEFQVGLASLKDAISGLPDRAAPANGKESTRARKASTTGARKTSTGTQKARKTVSPARA